MTPRKQVDQELSRERIIDVAHELFQKKGYQQVSMRQIASELNYSHGSIYYHFKNKAELFYAMVAKDFALLNETLTNIMELDLAPKDKLKEVFLGYIKFGLDHQSQYEVMFLIRDEELKNYLQKEPYESYQRFAESVYSLCGKKIEIKDIWSIFIALHGFVTHYCRSGQTFEDVKLLAISHVSFILKMID